MGNVSPEREIARSTFPVYLLPIARSTCKIHLQSCFCAQNRQEKKSAAAFQKLQTDTPSAAAVATIPRHVHAAFSAGHAQGTIAEGRTQTNHGQNITSLGQGFGVPPREKGGREPSAEKYMGCKRSCERNTKATHQGPSETFRRYAQTRMVDWCVLPCVR